MIGTNLWPDKLSCLALEKACEIPAFSTIRIWMDMKPANPPLNSSDETLNTVWLQSEKISSGHLSKMCQIARQQSLQVIWTLSPPDDWIPKRQLTSPESFARLWKSMLITLQKLDCLTQPLLVELSNEPGGDWTMQIQPKVYLSLVKSFLSLTKGLNPIVLVAGHHCVVTGDPFTKIIQKELPNHPQILYSLHIYEGQDKKFMFPRLQSYVSSVQSYASQKPLATEVATHMLPPNDSLQFALLSTQNAMMCLRAGFSTVVQWLGRDYDWMSEKWGWMDQKCNLKHAYYTYRILGFEKYLQVTTHPSDTNQPLVSSLAGTTKSGFRICMLNRDSQPRPCQVSTPSTILQIETYPPNLQIQITNQFMIPPQSICTILFKN
jgi:hypothetical protein